MASSLGLFLGTLVAGTKGWSDDSRLQASREEEGLEICRLTQVLGNQLCMFPNRSLFSVAWYHLENLARWWSDSCWDVHIFSCLLIKLTPFYTARVLASSYLGESESYPTPVASDRHSRRFWKCLCMCVHFTGVARVVKVGRSTEHCWITLHPQNLQQSTLQKEMRSLWSLRKKTRHRLYHANKNPSKTAGKEPCSASCWAFEFQHPGLWRAELSDSWFDWGQEDTLLFSMASCAEFWFSRLNNVPTGD